MIRPVLVALTMAVAAVCGAVLPATADMPDNSLIRTRDGVEASSRQSKARPPTRERTTISHSDGRSPSRYTYLPKDEYKSQMAAYRKSLQAAIAANNAALNNRGTCIDTTGQLACNRFQQVALPTAPNIRQAGDPAPPGQPAAAPALSPQEVAYIASARLRLTPPKPMVGPPPEINKWNMAAVGYPLWLWAEGTLDPAPVSDSVLDIGVSLDAHLVKVVFDMGDGHKVSCTDVSRKWTRGVKPGAKSPSCGYAYQRPSLPHGSYTITADAVWAVDWNINGTTGTLPFYQSASTELPVGELQVLVR